MTCVKLVKAILVCITVSESKLYFVAFLAALAALYLTLVTHSVSGCHFRILTKRVTFETSDPSVIWSE